MNDPNNTPDEGKWAPWTPEELTFRLNSVLRPWCIVGGWALDLWHGTNTRPHEDIEFTIQREDLEIFRHALSDLELYTVKEGKIKRLSDEQSPDLDISQIWCFDRPADRWRADMMIETGSDEIWVYKRDRQLTRPRSEMVALTSKGIPYLAPSAVLLFKAKYRRPKDEDDFENAVPLLPPSERLWLKNCLDQQHPGHPWARKL